MRIKYSRLLTMLLIFTMFLVLMTPAAFADESPGVELPVKVTLSGRPPTDDEDYRLILEADNPDYPMPAGSRDGVFSLIISGEDTIRLPELEYSSIGIYTYTVYLTPGDNELATYDDARYNLVVYVTESEDGSGLETTVILYQIGENTKFDELVFDITYEEDEDDPPVVPESPEPPKAPQTSDDTNIWPYVGLFISGAAMLFILGMTVIKRKIED